MRQTPWVEEGSLSTWEGEATLPWAQALEGEPCPMVMPEKRFAVPAPWPEHVSQMSMHWQVPRWKALLALDEAEQDHTEAHTTETAHAWQEAQWAVVQCSDRFQRQSLDHATFVTYWDAYQAEPPEESHYDTFDNFLWMGLRQARKWFDGKGRLQADWDDWLKDDTWPDRDLFLDWEHVHPVWADRVWSAFVTWARSEKPTLSQPECPASEK